VEALAAQHPVLLVLALAGITALCTGLGAVPFAFMRTVSDRTLSRSNALAAGLMLGACFGLLVEGSIEGWWQTLLGANLGVAFVVLTSRLLEESEPEAGDLARADARQMLLIVIVMTVHSFAEGVAVGASFAGGIELATTNTVAIAIHNIPEGIAITAVLRPKGTPLWKCAWLSVFSSLPQPLMAVPAFLFVEWFRPSLPFALGFAAGAMVLMVLQELLPEAYESGRKVEVGAVATLALIAMLLFQGALSG
jgi:ZIP family zinc transporter